MLVVTSNKLISLLHEVELVVLHVTTDSWYQSQSGKGLV